MLDHIASTYACLVGKIAMNVFDLDRALVNDYERFARSFTQIHGHCIWVRGQTAPVHRQLGRFGAKHVPPAL
jgi:hypothetical protein